MTPGRSASPVLLAVLLAGAPGTAQVAPFEAAAAARPQGRPGRLDELVQARLARLHVEPALPCSDEVFLRRVHLDVLGTLPTLAEAKRFLADRGPDKRGALIDALLQRPEHASYQAMRWCDLLRVKSEFPINLWPNAVQCYARWIADCMRKGLPFDELARSLLLASGSNFRVPEVNFWRATQERTPAGLAKVVALTFLGSRLEKWTPARQAHLAVFFSKVGFKGTQEWKEEIVYFAADAPLGLGQARGPVAATLPDGTVVTIAPGVDPRAVFAGWLLRKDNLSLSRAVSNRIWSWLMGRGIVHEPDDFRPDNPPSDPELLDWLARELVASGFRLEHLYRTILNSATYQRSALAPRQPAGAEALFASYPLRRLEAEVLIDAICQVTGTTEEYSSPIPEPFTWLPAGQRAVELGDGSITSAFLEMFGRPPRDTGLEGERSNQPTAAQRLHLLNSSHVQRKLQNGPNLQPLLRPPGRSSPSRPSPTVADLYLTILSRYPTPAELAAVQEYSQSGVANSRQVLEDLAWALINSSEFLYRH